MNRRIVPLFVLLSMLGSGSVRSEPATVTQETSLRPAPDARDYLAFLTPGTDVVLLEERGDWVRVRLEGWVRSDALRGAEPIAPAVPAAPRPADPPVVEWTDAQPPRPDVAPPDPAPAVTTAAAAPPLVATSGVRLVGQIDIDLSRKLQRDNTVAGTVVILLPETVELESTIDDELAAIEVSLADIKRATEKAMQQSNFTQAVQDRNRLNKERDSLLVERRNLVKAEHARHEQIARREALATAVADANGWFQLDGVKPARYSLYARMDTSDFDLEWTDSFTVGKTPDEITLGVESASGIHPFRKKK